MRSAWWKEYYHRRLLARARARALDNSTHIIHRVVGVSTLPAEANHMVGAISTS